MQEQLELDLKDYFKPSRRFDLTVHLANNEIVYRDLSLTEVIRRVCEETLMKIN